ncbi:DUF6169 family protein [Spirosoma sp. KNUC1025]|uniref:DUF6169 family protein n=1 Tax=Spirosoma sp. KNUC1025 TaxID=2894082 RepID=UPI0038662762|nr:DUF6169 family protein [Spirosoma sp. KNUC1025]
MEPTNPPPTNYPFRFEGGNDNSYAFTTSTGIAYLVRFKPTPYIISEEWVFHNDVYELVIDLVDNPTGKPPSLDLVIPATLAAIIRDFYTRTSLAITIYICDSSDGRQKSRERKFASWFQTYNPGTMVRFDYMIHDLTDGQMYYITLITSLWNPHIHDIITEFQRVANGYNDPK